jgi:hypothetical protein
MSATEAQIRANQQNAAKSSGPKTAEGKAISRANSFKHGLTGEGVVLPNEDVAEVENIFAAYMEDFQPSTAAGLTLVRRAAVLSVRLDRCVSHETASLRTRIRQAEADFVAPEGVDAEIVAQLKVEARALAMYDPSPEATRARRYEAETERGYFRALKELRNVEKQVNASRPGMDEDLFGEALGSLCQLKKRVEAFEARYEEPEEFVPPAPSNRPESTIVPPIGGRVDVPITIGRRP